MFISDVLLYNNYILCGPLGVVCKQTNSKCRYITGVYIGHIHEGIKYNIYIHFIPQNEYGILVITRERGTVEVEC